MYKYADLAHKSILDKYGSELHDSTHYVLALKWTPSRESHTIHGLWPQNDKINATAEAWSESALGITSLVLQCENQQIRLLDFLNQYWQSDLKRSNASFWKHEYFKHGIRMPEGWLNYNKTPETRLNNATYFSLVCSLFWQYKAKSDSVKGMQVEYHLDKDYTLLEHRSA